MIMQSRKKTKRLLVLTSATGAGHDTHALATAAWCSQLFGDGVQVRIEHLLEDSHKFYRGAVSFYNFIQRNAPWFHHIYFNFVEASWILNRGTVSLGRGYYKGILEEFRPDVILSVHAHLNHGYFELAREVLGSQVKCATFCAEFGGGYGFSRNWVHSQADYFFARTPDAISQTSAQRMPKEAAIVAGHWAPPEFYRPRLTEEERASYLKEKLQLGPTRFTLLLSTGGAGSQNHTRILRALKILDPEKIQVVALCGNDAVARKKLIKWAEREIPFLFRALPFTREMALLLQVCSAVVTRPGATTAGEALLCGCPVIFNAIGGIMPQEIPSWRYFKKEQIGYLAFTAEKIAAIVQNWVERPGILQEIRERIAQTCQDSTPELALRRLFGYKSLL